MTDEDLKTALLSQHQDSEPPEQLKQEVLDQINVLKLVKHLFNHYVHLPMHILEITLNNSVEEKEESHD